MTSLLIRDGRLWDKWGGSADYYNTISWMLHRRLGNVQQKKKNVSKQAGLVVWKGLRCHMWLPFPKGWKAAARLLRSIVFLHVIFLLPREQRGMLIPATLVESLILLGFARRKLK